MKRNILTPVLTALLITISISLSGQDETLFYKAAGTPANPRVQTTWNKYYTDAGITDLCKKLAAAYPDLVTLTSIGKSYQGRDIWTLTISDKKAGNPDRKPGFWIDGNIHSIELQGTEMALYTAWYLCEMYGQNAFIKQLLADKTFYITPTINPDARQYFTAVGQPPRSGLMPFDDDRDGQFDEDGPDDLDGDKNICEMRRKSTDGMYRTDPKDPRKMVRVEPGEKGEYEYLGEEGIDNDGDGMINEDEIGGYDGNRDWGFNWEPNYIQYGANKYPFSEPENQVVRDFIVNHRNIAGAQSFHNSGGLILRGPAQQGGGAEVFTRSDDNVLNTIGKKGEEIIPGYKFITLWKDMYTVYGGEIDWLYGAMGTYVLSNELWNSNMMFNDTNNTDEYEFDKYLLFGDAFVPWHKYNHPVYGEIEIGGFAKNFGRLHPGFLLESDAHRNAAFCIYNAFQSPKLEITKVGVKKLDNGLKEVTVTIENKRLLPTHSGENLKYRIDPPDYISIEGGQVIAGMIVNNADLNITREQKDNPQRMEVINIPGYQNVDLKWIVKGGSKYKIMVESVKGGRAEATAE
jgi:hypothetical protein